jgi:hypothetical protein
MHWALDLISSTGEKEKVKKILSMIFLSLMLQYGEWRNISSERDEDTI